MHIEFFNQLVLIANNAAKWLGARGNLQNLQVFIDFTTFTTLINFRIPSLSSSLPIHEFVRYVNGTLYLPRQYPFFIKHTDVKYIPHFHEETELVFVLEGALDVTLENNTFVLNEGEICIITPDLIHNLYSREPNITFVIKLFPVRDLGNIVLTNPVVSPGSRDYELLRQHICNIIKEDEKKLTGYELSVIINSEKYYSSNP